MFSAVCVVYRRTIVKLFAIERNPYLNYDTSDLDLLPLQKCFLSSFKVFW